MILKVYTTQICPKCRRLKNFLFDKGIEFEVMDMEDANTMTELFSHGVYTFNAPVLQIENAFLLTETMFNGVDLREDFIMKTIKEA